MDPEVEKLTQTIRKCLLQYMEDNPEFYFREEDGMIDGRLDIRALAVAILESQ